MLIFGFVTLLLTIVLFVLQACALNYFLIINISNICYLFVGLDGLLLLYMLSSYNIDYAATKGGIQWLFYTWIFLAKLIIFDWFLYADNVTDNSNMTLFEIIRIHSVFFFTPIIYTVLAFRSTKQLYGPSGTVISIENMLHADMVVHVMLDLIDLLAASRYAEKRADMKEVVWLHTFTRVFITVGIFMHSYSFPTTAGSTQSYNQISSNSNSDQAKQLNQHLPNPHEPSSQGDVFLTRKHAALVAMFLVDLPLLFIRLFLWINYPNLIGLDPLIIKNVIFLPIQAFRLNQCRLAEREQAKSSQRRNFISEVALPISNETADTAAQLDAIIPVVSHTYQHGKTGIPIESNTGEPVHYQTASTMRRRSSFISSPLTRRRKASVLHPSEMESISNNKSSKFNRATTLKPTLSDSENRKKLRSRSFDGFGFIPYPLRRTGPGSGQKQGGPIITSVVPENNSLKDNPQSMNEADEEFADGLLSDSTETDENSAKKICKILQDLKNVRDIPVKGFGIWRLFVKIFHCLRVGGRHGLAGILDETFVLNYWKQVRVAFPLVAAWSSQIVIVALTWEMKSSNGPPKPSHLQNWEGVPNDYKLFIYIASTNFGLFLIFWLGTAPLLDVIFVTVFWVVRLCCFFLVFTTVRDTEAFNLNSWNITFEKTEAILLWGFIILPCFRLLNALFPIQSAFLGRKYMYFVVPSANQSLQSSLLSSVSNFKQDQLTDKDKNTRSDEAGWVTTTSVLIFLNCRHNLSPMSYGELLIGPDLIKDIRLMDMLVVRCWLETATLVLIYCIALRLFFSYVNVGLFSGEILMRCIYNVFVQAIRLLAVRRYEIKILFEEIVRTWNDSSNIHTGRLLSGTNVLDFGADVGGDEDDGSGRHKDTDLQTIQRKKYISLLDVVQRYEKHGFFTSPGDLLPSFF